MAGGMVPGNEQVIYASPAGTSEFIQDLTVNEGRAAFVAVNTVSLDASLLVVNLANPAVSTRIDAAGIDSFALRGRYLAYAAAGAGGLRRVVLLDLTDGHETALASGLASAGTLVGVVLSNNKVVWSEPGLSASRIVSHDIPTGVSSILADAVPGRLAGATDTVFVMERFVEGDHNKADRIEIWKYENGGAGQKVEDFRADALAGQTTVLGQRIVFVNPQRRIIIVPLNGGDRKSVQPY